jgi:hypothetical protein
VASGDGTRSGGARRPASARPAFSPAAAEALAVRLLAGLTTSLAEPQIDHARRVAAGVQEFGDERLVAAAFLHDVLEKSGISVDELRDLTRDEAVVELVEVLSKADDEPYADYLARCAAHPDARLVKRIDLADKLAADTSGVPVGTARVVRREARRRLAAFDRMSAPEPARGRRPRPSDLARPISPVVGDARTAAERS